MYRNARNICKMFQEYVILGKASVFLPNTQCSRKSISWNERTSVSVECMFSTTGIISNGKRSSIGPAKLNRILFIHDNFAIVTSDNLQGRWHWRCVCLLSEDGFFARKPALKRLASAVRRVRPTGRSSYSRHESFERRLSCKRTSCRPDKWICLFFARESSLWIGALICKNTKAALLRTCSATH